MAEAGQLRIQNKSNLPVTYTIANEGWNCCDAPLPGQVIGPVPPKQTSDYFMILRKEGHGCGGKQGIFQVVPSLPNAKSQGFNFDSHGGLIIDNSDTNYSSRLIDEGSHNYTWEVDPERDYISNAALVHFIEQYGPVIYFHPEEKYFMTSAEAFLEQSSINRQPGTAASQLNSRTSYSADNDRLWLLPGADRAGDLSIAKAYVHAKPGFGHLDLQFWFLYMYNGCGTADVRLLLNPPLIGWFGGDLDTTVADTRPSLEPFGEHEGDWEHVDLRIDSHTGELLAVYFSQHDSGQWVAAQDLERVGRQVVVYSSHYGHASYPHAGANWSTHYKVPISPVNKAEFFLRNDCDKGQALDCSRHYELVSVEHPVPGEEVSEPAWLRFPGRWGGHREENLTPENVMPILERGFGIIGDILGGSLVSVAWPFMSQIDVEGQDGPGAPIKKTCWLGAEDA